MVAKLDCFSLDIAYLYYFQRIKIVAWATASMLRLNDIKTELVIVVIVICH